MCERSGRDRQCRPIRAVVDPRPANGGEHDLGFNEGQLLYLAIGGCVSNDLFREATARGI